MTLDEVDKKVCPNCQREIPTNFDLHTVHCLRSLQVCPKCKETVQRKEYEVHLQTVHKDVHCPDCYATVENCQLEQHQAEVCAKRLLKCPFCEIESPADAMQEHVEYCGSRTEVCKTCGQFVMLKDEAIHLASGHAATERKKPNNNNNLGTTYQNDANSAFNSIRLNQLSNLPRAAPTPRQSPPSKRTNDMPQLNTHAGGAADSRKEPDKKIIADLNQSQNANMEELDKLLAFHLAEEDFENNIDPTDLSYLLHANPYSTLLRDQHEFDPFGLPTTTTPAAPLPHVEAAPPADHLWDRVLADAVSLSEDMMQSPLHMDSGDTRQVDQEELIPCEFCTELFPLELLIQHQSGCRPDIAHGLPREDLNNAFVTESLDQQRQVQQSRSPPPPFDYLRNLEADFETDHGTTDPMNEEDTLTDMIPCEFCGDQFPAELLIQHQNFCGGTDEVDDAPVREQPAVQPPLPQVQPQVVDYRAKENSPPRGTLPSHREVSPKAAYRPSPLRTKETNRTVKAEPRPPPAVPSYSTTVHSNLYAARGRNVPISVASNYPTARLPGGDAGYLPSVRDAGLRRHSTGDPAAGAPSPVLNTFLREMRNTLNPVKEAAEALALKHASGQFAGTGTRPKNQSGYVSPLVDINRTRSPSVPSPVPQRISDTPIPSYLRSADGSIEDAFKAFLAQRTAAPQRTIGQYTATTTAAARVTPPPASSRVGSDYRPNAGYVHTYTTSGRQQHVGSAERRLPPIHGTGAVPKQKGARPGHNPSE